jgi:biopolymer transport protein ExbD
MLIAPLLQKGVNVRLPIAEHTTEKPSTQEETVVHVDAQKQLYVNNIQVSESEAVDRIKFALEEKAERVVYLKGDTDAPYSAVMNLMDKLREAGIENVALITDSKKKAGEGGGD